MSDAIDLEAETLYELAVLAEMEQLWAWSNSTNDRATSFAAMDSTTPTPVVERMPAPYMTTAMSGPHGSIGKLGKRKSKKPKPKPLVFEEDKFMLLPAAVYPKELCNENAGRGWTVRVKFHTWDNYYGCSYVYVNARVKTHYFQPRILEEI